MLTVGVIVSQVALANEKALRLHPAQNAPQGVSPLRTQVQTRLRRSKNVSKVPSRKASMRMWVRGIDSLDTKICAWTQRTVRKALEERDQALRVRLRKGHPGFRSATFAAPAFCEWPQRTQPGNRPLASSARPALCLWMRQANQAQPPSVEARRVSLHFGAQSGCARRRALRVEGRMLASQASPGESQGLSSLASSGSKAGPLYLPEVRRQKEFGSRPYGGLLRDRCAHPWRLSSHPRSSYAGDRNNPLSELPSWQACDALIRPNDKPSLLGLRTDQEFRVLGPTFGNSLAQRGECRPDSEIGSEHSRG